MRGTFVNWAMGVMSMSLIGASAFVLVTPTTADALLFGHDTAFEKPPSVAMLKPSVLSHQLPDCVVISARDGLPAQQLDRTRIALGAGTVLEGTVSPHPDAFRARVLNGPHSGQTVDMVVYGWADGTADGDWAGLSACTWAATAELDGLWEGTHRHGQRIMERAEAAVPGGLWEDPDRETERLMYWPGLRRAQAAEWRARVRYRERDGLPADRVVRSAWYVSVTVEKARMSVTWIDRFGTGEPASGDDSAAIASLR